MSDSQKWIYLEQLKAREALLSEEILSRLSRDDNPEIRLYLAETLAGYELPLSEKILTEMLDDTDELVRANVCDSLSFSKSENVLKKLIYMLKNDKCIVRQSAMLSISDIIVANRFTEYMAELKAIIKAEKGKSVWLGYYGLLYKLGDKSHLYKLAKGLNGTRYSMRCLTANILGDIAKPEDYDKVIGILSRRLSIEKIAAVISTLEKNIEILENKKNGEKTI